MELTAHSSTTVNQPIRHGVKEAEIIINFLGLSSIVKYVKTLWHNLLLGVYLSKKTHPLE